MSMSLVESARALKLWESGKIGMKPCGSGFAPLKRAALAKAHCGEEK
jgi:hypothetical protein